MKKAIIVGASSGIGMELARILAGVGYKVGITGRRLVLLTALAEEAPDNYIVLDFDVSVTSMVTSQLDHLSLALGGIDLIVISSGTGELNTTLDFKVEAETTATNVNGFTAVADWAFNKFKQQGFGHLAAITSVAGLRGSRHAPAYNASKAYQINYLEGLSQMASQLKIPVYITDARPGFVETAMAKGEGQFWVAKPAKAAKQIFDAIRQKKDVVYITQRWRLIAILLKILPRFMYKKL